MNWKENTLTLSDLQLDISEIYLNLGYGGTLPDSHIAAMVEAVISEIAEFCKPMAGFCIYKASMPDSKFLVVNNQAVKVGQVITKYLQGCTHIALFVVTVGVGFDDYCNRLKAEGDIVSEFIAYSIGTEIAESAVRYVTKCIENEANSMQMGCTYSYSPGYCSWHVREQENLFRLMPENPCGIVLNDSNLMFPEKSVSGITGLGKEVKPLAHSCEICGMVSCFKRKKI